MLKWFRDQKARRILEEAGYCPIHLVEKTVYALDVDGNTFLDCDKCVAERSYEDSRRIQAAISQLKGSKNV